MWGSAGCVVPFVWALLVLSSKRCLLQNSIFQRGLSLRASQQGVASKVFGLHVCVAMLSPYLNLRASDILRGGDE